MQTTFYIASPFINRFAVREFASVLIEKGWCWSDNHDWTLKSFAEGPDKSDPFWNSWAVRDMHAALSADVFILLLKDKTSAGAHGELCARWALHRPIFAIRQGGDDHLFHKLPGIVWFDTIEEWMQATFGP